MNILTDQFANMDTAQKTYVLSTLVNKIFQNPKDYGLNADGTLQIGSEVDFTKLFEDTKEIKSIFDKAQETIAPDSAQEESILANNEKIAAWVKENPNAKLSNNKVAEILSTKPKAEVIQEPESKPESQVVVEPVAPEPPAPPAIPETEVHNMEMPHDAINESRIHQEIAEAKARLAELETPRNPHLERTLASDSKAFISDIKFKQDIEEAFRREIDGVYGKSGLLGMGKTAGIKTKEWAEIARLPASKVVEYYTGDSKNPNLADVAEKLSKSNKHGALMKQVTGLMEKSSGAVRPFENENVEQFIKRLGGFIMRDTLQSQTQKAV